MPFGWVLVALTTLGAIGGAVTGLSAHSLRTASGLPMEQPEPFEQARFITASVPVPAPQEELAAASTSWIDEPALFSPVLAYPVRVASVPAAATPPPATRSGEAPDPGAPARHASSRPGSVLNYAQIASIKKRLNPAQFDGHRCRS
jgi:hypothetical protein